MAESINQQMADALPEHQRQAERIAVRGVVLARALALRLYGRCSQAGMDFPEARIRVHAIHEACLGLELPLLLCACQSSSCGACQCRLLILFAYETWLWESTRG